MTLLAEEKKLTAAFELKIASYNTTLIKEKKRIFNDLMRLYLLSQNGVDAYFIMSGYYEDFMSYFRSIQDKKELKEDHSLDDDEVKSPSGYYTKWFSFVKDTEVIIEIKNESNLEYSNVYNNFYKTYNFKPNVKLNKKLPEQIVSKCISLSPISNESPLPYLTAVWKIN